MHLKPVLFCALAMLAAAATSQTAGSFSGKWAGSTKNMGGGDLVVDLVIVDGAGTWRFVRQGNQGRNNPCLEKDLPVVVVSQSASELSLKIDGAKVLQGCLDQVATLKSADGKLLEGTLDDGRPVSLTRR